MTKQEFLKRCETIWAKGFIKNRNIVCLLRDAAECFVRLRSVYAHNPALFDDIKKQLQGDIAVDLLTGFNTYDKDKLLAGDPAYKCVELAAILGHPCQICSEDPNAWHTRSGFCPHKGEWK